MSIVIEREPAFVVAPVVTGKPVARWQLALKNWFATQNSLRRHWDRFGMTASGRRVPYRVWSRHGAYLQIQREARRH